MTTGRLAFFHRSGRRAARTDHIPQVWRSGTCQISESSASRFYKDVRKRSSLPAVYIVYYQDGRSPRAPTARTSRTRPDGPASASCAAGRTICSGPIPGGTFIAVAGGLPRSSLAGRLLLRAASVTADARQQASLSHDNAERCALIVDPQNGGATCPGVRQKLPSAP